MSSLVGAPAPSFSLPAVDGALKASEVTLESFRGRWLALLFYPRDFSFVCPTELTTFSGKLAEFAERDCDVLAVSIDTIESHRAWLETGPCDGGVSGLRYPLGSDSGGDVCRSYGVWRDGDELPNRGLFLIDPEGIVQYAVVHGLGVGRSVDEVLRVLDALRSGGLCPANWVGTDGTLDVRALLQPGRVLGHYRLGSEVGRGSFGSVFEASDLQLERQVALKLIREEAGTARSKILAEARAAAAVAHPSVCTVHAVEEIDGLPVIVMEFLSGGGLDELIGEGLSGKAFWATASRLASGLSAAHSAGVVHGDLKPGNVLLRGPKDPVLVDFGLARSQREASPASRGAGSSVEGSPLETLDVEAGGLPDVQAAATADVEVTATVQEGPTGGKSDSKVLTGTPAYMSPEQARGDPVTAASDLYALGLVFVKMLNGTGPFDQYSNLLDILRALYEPECGARIAATVAEEYRALIHALLDTDPERRPTADEVVAACEGRRA